MRVLVTGGAGYIGSHTIKYLKKSGCSVLVYDNLSRGHRKAVSSFPLITGDLAETGKLTAVLKKYHIDAVMHFAAYCLVEESVREPDLYYQNNVAGSLSLLKALVMAKVRFLVFSSSAAVYGEPEQVPVSESNPLRPASPYGETKAVIERAFQYYEQAYDIKTVSLRYFNAAGGEPDGSIGEDHRPETHLIPLILQVAMQREKKLIIYGDDYPTSDGFAVRDFIHVSDLARAHVLALKALAKGRSSPVYNLGNEKGYSVLEVIKAAERVLGCKIPYEVGLRRPGDPAILVSSSEKAKRELHWQPAYSSLENIIQTAWNWQKKNPAGFS